MFKRQNHRSEKIMKRIIPGLTFTRDSACGRYVSRVLNRHQDGGYWETTIESGGHPALIGSLQVVSDIDILRAISAEKSTDA